MAQLVKYNIAFKGLGLGKHEYEYQIGQQFFEYFNGGIADEGNVDVKLVLEKQSALMVLSFHVEGTVKIQCDRCLDIFNQQVESQNKVFIKYGKEQFNDGDDVIWLSPDDSQVNVAKLIYDLIILAIPIKHIHPDDATGNSLCNPEMIKKLAKLSILEAQKPATDSRWDELKKLLDNK